MTNPTPWECAHESTEVRGKRTTVGIQYRKQCLTCGRSASNAISHALVTTFVDWDEDLERRWEDQASQFHRVRREAREAELNQTAEAQESYRLEYMRSPEWWAKRTAVMERELGVCQGCRTAKANQVHHLTYRHLGRELLFELVALCRPCHEAAHDLVERQS